MAIYRIEIPMKLPSLNTYINECRKNRYAGAKFKNDLERDISFFIGSLPRIEKPIKIAFEWVEENRKRDIDNLSFAKKFILDAMVKAGVLENDNRKHVTAFTDTFSYGKEAKVIMWIEEIEED
jgi:Holliday junction resolvase RusA-like endonuclease